MHEVERLKLDGEQTLADTNKQWEFKYKALEEKSRNLLQLKNDMENEIRSLNEGMVQMKNSYEQEIRDQLTMLQQEEY